MSASAAMPPILRVFVLFVKQDGYAPRMPFASIDELEVALARASYLPDRGLSTALYLSLTMEKPLLLEGEAGVGKTEAAKSIAVALGALLYLERGRFSPDTLRLLEARGHKVHSQAPWGVQDLWGDGECIEIDLKTGERLGASDARNNGKAVGY